MEIVDMAIWTFWILVKILDFQISPQNDGGDDGDGDGVPRTLPIWQEPWSITCRDQISRSGIPHFDNVVKIIKLLVSTGVCSCSARPTPEKPTDFKHLRLRGGHQWLAGRTCTSCHYLQVYGCFFLFCFLSPLLLSTSLLDMSLSFCPSRSPAPQMWDVIP